MNKQNYWTPYTELEDFIETVGKEIQPDGSVECVIKIIKTPNDEIRYGCDISFLKNTNQFLIPCIKWANSDEGMTSINTLITKLRGKNES